eukprot:15456490-Alexandrium_andersonii.AAC.1
MRRAGEGASPWPGCGFFRAQQTLRVLQKPMWGVVDRIALGGCTRERAAASGKCARPFGMRCARCWGWARSR